MALSTTKRVGFQHQPLKNTGSIRVLYLQPGQLEDDIKVELTEVSLASPPSYEALSYVWGSPTANDPISCHGKELLVTVNCIAAMRRLRNKKKHRVLWIDAICINQNLMDERNKQVELMGDVYSKARRVILWLGEESNFSDFTISFLKSYHKVLKKKWLGPFRRRRLKEKRKGLLSTVKMATQDGLDGADVLGSICNRSWFTRKWMIQEFILGHESYFQCGDKTIQSSELFGAIEDINKQWVDLNKTALKIFHLDNTFWAYLNCYNAFRKTLKHTGDRRNFISLDILARGRFHTATNAKDAVFGLYGVLQRMDVNIPRPDYSKSVEQICTEATKLIIIHDISLRILLETSESKERPGLPSWVPDWNMPLRHGIRAINPEYSIFTASGSSSAEFKFPNEANFISVQGIFVDRITCTAKKHISLIQDLNEFTEVQPGPRSSTERQRIDHIEACREWIEIAYGLTTYPYGETAKDSFFRTLVPRRRINSIVEEAALDGFNEWLGCFDPGISTMVPRALENFPSNELQDTEQTLRFARHSENGSMERSSAQVQPNYDVISKRIEQNEKAMTFDSLLLHLCKETRLFTTSEGHLCKGLKAIQEGDLVALIAGVHWPLVIRKEGGLYRSKGPAYIHGIMFGEKWPDNRKVLIDIVLS